MKKALIIGGGFAGLATAHQLSLLGGSPPWDVTILEAGNALGAGVRTQFLGGHPHTFGPRHFLTQKPYLFEYLNAYCPLRRHPDHEFYTYIEKDCAFYNYPIHEDDISLMPEKTKIYDELDTCDRLRPKSDPQNFEEFWIDEVGPTLYNKFINEYSKKMWMLDTNTKLSSFDWSPKGTTIKRGPRAGWDTAISAYPTAPNGYNDYFDLAAKDARVLYRTRWTNKIQEVAKEYDLVVSTIAIDTLFEYVFGRLPFIGRDVTPIVLPVEMVLPEKVYFCYYAGSEPYTRVTEYKKFTHHSDSSSTLITIEKPSHNGRLYPLPTDSAQKLAKRYRDQLPKNVKSIGRAGSYNYRIDIDDCIDQAMDIVRFL